jgi:hypothetical protein
MGACDPDFDDIVATLKRCAAWLREAGIEHVLAGSAAAWARGGPAICSDLDFLVRPKDSAAALEVLAGHGLRPEHPPEGWLVKAHDGPVGVDLIHDPTGVDVDEAFARADVISVMSVDLPVMAVDDILVTKLSAFEEHYIDFVGLLPIARALREQADWEDVRRRTADSAIAHGFLAMAERLGIVAPPAPRLVDDPADAGSRIRVTSA